MAHAQTTVRVALRQQTSGVDQFSKVSSQPKKRKRKKRRQLFDRIEDINNRSNIKFSQWWLQIKPTTSSKKKWTKRLLICNITSYLIFILKLNVHSSLALLFRMPVHTFLKGVTPHGLSSCPGWPEIINRPAGSDWTCTWFKKKKKIRHKIKYEFAL